jgi:hypothetical protein
MINFVFHGVKGKIQLPGKKKQAIAGLLPV